MNKKRIGICGCTGHVTKFGNMVNSFDESETVVVWDYQQERGKAVAEELNIPFESDYTAFLENYGLDGIIVTAENSHKAQLCIQAADHGISLFVEKPLCVNLQEAYAVKEAVYRNNVKFYMTDPFVRKGVIKIRDILAEGTLGEVKEATIRLGQTRPRFEEQFSEDTSQGGIMADVGGHALHIAHYLFGKPEKVSAILSYNTPYAKQHHVETNARVTMIYPDDLLVSLECSFVSRGLDHQTIIHGSKATVSVVYDATQSEGAEHLEIYTDDINKEIITDLPQPPKRHIRYFVEMLAYDYPNDIIGRDPFSNSGVSIDHAVEYVEIINAVYESAETGKVATVK